MRWGLLVRPETGRGLGVQSYGLYFNLHPDSVLIVSTSDTYDKDYLRYGSGAWIASFENGKLPEEFVRDWLADLDVVISVETVYDPRLYDWARDANCRTVVQVNPEFIKPGQVLPDCIWLPTKWRQEVFPDDARLVRFPIDQRDFVSTPDTTDPVNFLHIAGKPALADRNGTELFATSLRRCGGINAKFRVTVQGHEPANVSERATVLFNPSFEEIYKDQHILVLPRRYGGNCLPVNEAIGHGMGIIMTDIEPNQDWPIQKLHSNPGRIIDMPCGAVRLFDADVEDMKNSIVTLTNNRKTLIQSMSRSRAYADQYSWSNMKQTYLDEIELASAADYRPRGRARSLPYTSTPDLGIFTRKIQRN